MKFTDEQLNEVKDFYKDVEFDPSKIRMPEMYIDDEGLHFTISMESVPGVMMMQATTISKDISKENYESCPFVNIYLEGISYEDFIRGVNKNRNSEPLQNTPNLRLVKDDN